MVSDPPWFRVLGPLELGRSGRAVPLSGARQRELLAVLLAARGSTVPVDVLVELLWGGSLPASPSAALHSQISRLRRTLAGLLTAGCDLVTRSPGYALLVPPAHLDSVRFEQLVGQARARGGDLQLYEEALRLWRGPAFAEFADLPPTRLEGIRLGELHAAVVEERAEALLEAGRPQLVVPDLEAFVAEHPLREGARAALMRGLYATGRHSDALREYQRYRHHLAEELGLEPSAALQRLEHRVLTHDLSPPSAGPASQVTGPSGLQSMQVRYVRPARGPALATATVGTGPPLVVVPAWVTSLDVLASGRDPRSSLVEHLIHHAAVTLYDRAGTGLSQGPVEDFTVETSADELLAVLEATGEATLLAASQAGPVAVVAAVRRPDLVRRLVMFGTYADGGGVFTNTAQNRALVTLTRANFHMGAKVLADLYRPGASADAGEHLARVLRDSADAAVAAGYLEETYRTDVTPLLGRVTQPALVLHYRHDHVVPFRGGEQLAAGLARARFVPLDGTYHLPDAADLPRIVALVSDFLADAPPSR